MRRRRTLLAFAVLATTAVVAGQQAFAADSDPHPTNPTGFGDLLPTPDLTNGDTRTLFEQYGPMAYGIDFDTGIRDGIKPVFNGFAHMLMMYIVAITRGAISVGWWLFSLTDIESVSEATAQTIGLTSAALAGWLLPSALAFGAIVAFMHRRANGSAMSQLLWVFAAGIVSVSFVLSASTWLRGIDGTRQLGAEAVMAVPTQVLGGTVQSPIRWSEPSFSGSSRDTLLRKSADATWRGFAATPWCIAEFGSVEACQRYGKGVLDRGTDGDARMDYINNEISKAEGGGDTATVKWTKGKNPFGRIGVLVLAAIAATIFAFLSISLAFAAMMAFIGCLLLMIVGVFFACLWIIPGRPRQWGLNWFEALLGLVLQSVMAMLVFGSVLTLVTAVFSLTETLGWLPVCGLAIVVLLAGFRLRRLLESLTTMMRPGMASMVMGSMARRGAMSLVSRLVTSLQSRANAPVVRERRHASDAPSTVGTTPSRRVAFRQLPAAGRPAPAHLRGHQRRVPELVPGGMSVANPSDSGPGIASRLNGRSINGDRILSPSRQSLTLPRGQLTATAAADSQVDRLPLRVSVGNARGHALRSTPRPLPSHPLRHDTHDFGRSAGLRDGPPKSSLGYHRPRREASSAVARSYRQYAYVSKEQTTLRVPVGG